MISTIASGIGFIIGIALAVLALGVVFGVLGWIALIVVRAVARAAVDFVPGLKRWKHRNDNPFRF